MMAYWNNGYVTQPMTNYGQNNLHVARNFPPGPPATGVNQSSGNGICVLVAIVTGFLVAAALTVPITLALTYSGPFSTRATSDSSTSTSSITTLTSTVPWSQCSFHRIINDSSRLISATGGSNCDLNLFSSNITWVRFLPPGGTQLLRNITTSNQCGTQATGWYNGSMPSTGMTVNGTVCYNWGSPCTWSNMISITNCGAFFVYGLIAPPVCNLRYCTV